MALAPAAVLACNAIIGTEDRFYDADASIGSTHAGDGASANDATSAANGHDGASSGDDDASGDASDGSARADGATDDGSTGITDGSASDGDANCDASGTCPLPPPLLSVPASPAVTGFDVDPGYVYLAAGTTGVYSAPIAPDGGVEAGASVYFLDGDGTHKLVDVAVTNGTLYMLEDNSAQGEPYIYSCAAQPGTCTTRSPVIAAPSATEFAIGGSYLYFWGASEIYRQTLAGAQSTAATSSGTTGVAVGTSYLFAGSASGIDRIVNPTGTGFGGSRVINTRSTPTSLAVDEINVYGADPTHGTIVQYGQAFTATDVPAIIATGVDNPRSLRLDSGNLYWLADQTGSVGHGVLMSCPAPDCMQVAPTVVQVMRQPVELVVRSDAFYVQDVLPNGKTAIYRLPR